jgi:hypothetical protein
MSEVNTVSTDDYYIHEAHEMIRDQQIGLWGILISIIGSLFMASGLCLQKSVLRDNLEDLSRGPAYKDPKYLAGDLFITFTVITVVITAYHYLE